jgi:hypothetical protein
MPQLHPEVIFVESTLKDSLFRFPHQPISISIKPLNVFHKEFPMRRFISRTLSPILEIKKIRFFGTDKIKALDVVVDIPIP